jgi:hypothetical protein
MEGNQPVACLDQLCQSEKEKIISREKGVHRYKKKEPYTVLREPLVYKETVLTFKERKQGL